MSVVVARDDFGCEREAEPEVADHEVCAFGPFSLERCAQRVAVKRDGFGQICAGERDVVHASKVDIHVGHFKIGLLYCRHCLATVLQGR